MYDPHSHPRIVYLFGAGASHACVKAVGSAHGILMRDLSQELAEQVRTIVENEFGGNDSLRILANEVINETTDFEHVITFLDESSSALHRAFADKLRLAFEAVLRMRLRIIEAELGRRPDDLYFALLDMYEVSGFPEQLRGFLTLNYDTFLESALERSRTHSCDRGIAVGAVQARQQHIKTLKLHGSFDWTETWPVTLGDGPSTLWIPPGIQKAKARYPFNLIWGLARELLDCDVLRVIGCRLSSNDWDLLSLLFATRHTHTGVTPYRIEIIDSPKLALRLQNEHPYLDVRSILEVDRVGDRIVSELTGTSDTFRSMSEEQKAQIRERIGTSENWFRVWLKHMAEETMIELGTVSTASGAFENLLESY